MRKYCNPWKFLNSNASDYTGTLHEDIRSYLTHLFNTKKGSILHLSDYGMLDINKIYDNMPQSLHDFIMDIKSTIVKYEPRLHDVQIKLSQHHASSILAMEISAHVISGSRVVFNSYFMSGGRAYLDINRC